MEQKLRNWCLTIQQSSVWVIWVKLMRNILLRLAVGFTLLAANLAAQTHYFPAKTFGEDPRSDQFISSWYSGQLRALGQPWLFELSTNPAIESYRFTWLRTFHHPVAVRVDVQPDGTATLSTRMTSGAGGYDPGKLILNTDRPLTTEETQRIISQINASGFWRLPSYVRDNGGMDGSEWVMEAAVHGKYHLVSVWTPKDGPIHDLGTMFLFDLAKMKLPNDEVY